MLINKTYKQKKWKIASSDFPHFMNLRFFFYQFFLMPQGQTWGINKQAVSPIQC